jgi:hypothetical protein
MVRNSLRDYPAEFLENKFDILLNKPPSNVENTTGDSERTAAISDQWGGLMGRQKRQNARDR